MSGINHLLQKASVNDMSTKRLFSKAMHIYLHFLDRFVRFQCYVGNIGVDHEAEEVEDEVSMTTQVQKCSIALSK